MNRKDRRKAEKSLGLLRQNSTRSFRDRMEIYKRKREMGKKIHIENLQNNYNKQQLELDSKLEIKIKKFISEGYSEENAIKMAKMIREET